MNLTYSELSVSNRRCFRPDGLLVKAAIIFQGLSFMPADPTALAQPGKSWTLDACIEYALTRNIQVRKDDLANQSNQFYADQAVAQRFPSVNAGINQNFNWSHKEITGSSGLAGSNSSSYSVNSSVNLFNGNKTTNLIKQANLNVRAGEYSLETTRETISLSILDAFLQVLYAEEQVKNSEKQIESTVEQLNLASERLLIQVISQSDYAQVKSQLASEKLTLANARSQLAIAQVSLEQLMELPVSGDFAIAHPDLQESLNQMRKPDVSNVYDTALAIKPQIKMAAMNKAIAALDEKIAKAGYYPSLSASAGINSGYSSETSSTYGNQLDRGLNPSVGFSLSIPIYQRKQVITNIAIAKIGFRNAELSEIDTKNQLRKNIEQACQDVTSAQIKYEASTENYQATLESAALSDERFKQGIINSVDYSVSKTNLIVAESQLLQAKYNLIFSYKILDFYSGIPLSL
jgi:outer membrane protein